MKWAINQQGERMSNQEDLEHSSYGQKHPLLKPH